MAVGNLHKFESGISYEKLTTTQLSISFILLLIIPVILALLAISHNLDSETIKACLIFGSLPTAIALMYISLWYFHVFRVKEQYGLDIIIGKGAIGFTKADFSVEFPSKTLKEIYLTASLLAPGGDLGVLAVGTCKFSFSDEPVFEMRFNSRKYEDLQKYLETNLKQLGLAYEKKVQKIRLSVQYVIR